MRLLILLALVTTGAACSSGETSSPVAPTPPPTAGTPAPPGTPPSGGPLPVGTTITITATGMMPLEMGINVGQRVTFVNNDTRPHDLVGGIDPNNPDCPEITAAGFLTPGQSRDTLVFTRARTCEYHDHTMLSVPAFQGRIIIR